MNFHHEYEEEGYIEYMFEHVLKLKREVYTICDTHFAQIIALCNSSRKTRLKCTLHKCV